MFCRVLEVDTYIQKLEHQSLDGRPALCCLSHSTDSALCQLQPLPRGGSGALAWSTESWVRAGVLGLPSGSLGLGGAEGLGCLEDCVVFWGASQNTLAVLGIKRWARWLGAKPKQVSIARQARDTSQGRYPPSGSAEDAIESHALLPPQVILY